MGDKLKYLGLAALLLVVGCSKDEMTISDQSLLKQTIEYGQTIDLSPEKMGIQAKDQDLIEYTEVDLNKVGKHEVVYSYKGQIIEIEIHVVDKQAPIIEGVDSITIASNQINDIEMLLQLKAMDNVDGDITSEIECDKLQDVTVESVPLVCRVRDSSANVSEKTIQVTIQTESNEQVVVFENGIINGLAIDPHIVSNPDSLTVMVNKLNALPDDYAPSDLVEVVDGQTFYLRSEAATAYQALANQALNDGITLHLLSAYRTKEYQAGLFENYYNQNGAQYAATYSAISRRSEHELGLAIDVGDQYYLDAELDDTETGKWLIANAASYGFVLRYPSDKILITQYGFEPWHFRYVGIELATILKDSNLTLEEYYSLNVNLVEEDYRFE